ncbi:MAG: hypothetical protein ACKPA7_28165, partial [Sphaerospermopsis kisseleviana]
WNLRSVSFWAWSNSPNSCQTSSAVVAMGFTRNFMKISIFSYSTAIFRGCRPIWLVSRILWVNVTVTPIIPMSEEFRL